jgi:hypothetical protein
VLLRVLLPLAAASAIDPLLVASVAVMLSRERALGLLAAYFVGGAAVSVAAGVIVLFVLGQAGLSGGSVPPGVDVAAGVVLLVFAVVVGSGAGARLLASVRGHRATGAGKGSGGGPARSLVDRVRSGDSLWIALLAGAAWGTPGVLYLAGLAVIARSGHATLDQVVAILLFNVVMFALVELPLLAFVVAPGPTRRAVGRFSHWLSAHRRAVVAAIAGGIGVYLLVKGIS